MFTPVSARAATAYRQVGVETSIGGADSHQLVVLLFDGLFDALAKVTGAMERKDYQEKARQLDKAIQIIDEGLRSVLDKEQGGDLAANLDALYRYALLELTHANFNNNPDMVRGVADVIRPVADAWKAIRPQMR
jgi:flagellar protein FliS